MKNQKGVSLIALIITIIVIIILAAIVMNASTDTVGNAQFARFSQEFGEFNDQVALDAADVKSNTGIRGQIINNAQNFYMVANGFTNVGYSGDGQGIAGYTLPGGYELTNNNSSDATYKYILQNILRIGLGSGDKYGTTEVDAGKTCHDVDSQVAYIINDGVITNYEKYGNNNANGSASHEFYGDSNGAEYHFITSDGQVFTLPGYPVQQADGTIQYHIDTKSGHYYVVKGNATDLEVGDKNVNGDVITNEMPILASYLTDVHGLDSNNADADAIVATAYTKK